MVFLVRIAFESVSLLVASEDNPRSQGDALRCGEIAVVEGDARSRQTADGYGCHLVHAYNGEGCYEFSLSGEEGAGRFDCPHNVAIDPRPGHECALLVADRGNRRVQEFDRGGRFLRSWGSDFLDSPNGFDFRNGLCVISELHGRITIVDADNHLVETIGAQPNARFLPQWPNVDRSMIREGPFNSPHGAAWGHGGELYVVEWIKHGRVTRLDPALHTIELTDLDPQHLFQSLLSPILQFSHFPP